MLGISLKDLSGGLHFTHTLYNLIGGGVRRMCWKATRSVAHRIKPAGLRLVAKLTQQQGELGAIG